MTDRRIALERQVDGLLKKQAALLEVQPDIDLVSEALPARKKELERLEQQIKEKEILITAAQAIAGWFAKKPYDRNAVIQWLQLTKQPTAYGPLDELARQTVVKLMAKQGFVPTESLRALKENADKTISVHKEKTKMWKNIAKKRLGELEACQKQLTKKSVAEDKKLDESIDKKIVNIVTGLQKKLQPS